MTTPNPERVDYVLTRLLSPNAFDRATTLRVLTQRPVADRRVLARTEELLTDTTPCLLEIPLLYGEVRWRAAQAVAALRAVLGEDEVVELKDVGIPLNRNQVLRLARENDVRSSPGSEDEVLECMKILQQLGVLPTRGLVEVPSCYRDNFKEDGMI